MQRQMSGAVPTCAVCCETLGKFGGPTSLPCGHNGCLQCMARVQRVKPECPLCRAPFPHDGGLVVNPELRDLVALAKALSTIDVEHDGGWQAVTSAPGALDGKADEGAAGPGVALVPTAPPMHTSLTTVRQGGGDIMSLEPPLWLPDSHALACRTCEKPFQPLRRARHHCRLCGQIFCHGCSSQHLLLPPKFQQRDPQRCCGACAELLEPLQPFLAGTMARAVQPAVHDLTDGSVARAWFNNPLSSDLRSDVYKATNILRGFAQVGSLQPERGIPAAVLRGAAGFAILSVLRAGMGWSGAVGTGLMVVRRPGCAGGWSPPSALGLAGVGWGLQAGGALHDLLIVLRNQAAVHAFCGNVQAGLGGTASLAIGPLGRQADAALRMGASGAALCYSYSCTRGAFAGISVEGTVVYTRPAVNHAFYGRSLPARQLLLGDSGGPPAAAAPLYAALDELLARTELPLAVTEASGAGPLPTASAAAALPAPEAHAGLYNHEESDEEGPAFDGLFAE